MSGNHGLCWRSSFDRSLVGVIGFTYPRYFFLEDKVELPHLMVTERESSPFNGPLRGFGVTGEATFSASKYFATLNKAF